MARSDSLNVTCVVTEEPRFVDNGFDGPVKTAQRSLIVSSCDNWGCIELHINKETIDDGVFIIRGETLKKAIDNAIEQKNLTDLIESLRRKLKCSDPSKETSLVIV